MSEELYLEKLKELQDSYLNGEITLNHAFGVTLDELQMETINLASIKEALKYGSLNLKFN